MRTLMKANLKILELENDYKTLKCTYTAFVVLGMLIAYKEGKSHGSKGKQPVSS